MSPLDIGVTVTNIQRSAGEPTPSARKDPSWLKMTGFDNIMTPEDLKLEQEVRERAWWKL